MADLYPMTDAPNDRDILARLKGGAWTVIWWWEDENGWSNGTTHVYRDEDFDGWTDLPTDHPTVQ